MRWLSKSRRPPTLPTHFSDDSEEEDYLSQDELQVLVDKLAGDRRCESLHDSEPDHDSNDYRHHREQLNTHHRTRPWHKQPRYAGLLRSTIVSVSVLLLLAAFSGYWIIHLLLIRYSAYMHSVTALPIIPNGRPVEHMVQPFDPVSTPETLAAAAANPPLHSRTRPIQQVQDELDKRYTTINAPVSTMTCQWTLEDETRYRPLASQGPYLFAMNLFNNQQVIPTLAKTLLQLSEVLGRDNMLVSVFENGSTDNTTLALAHTAAAFTAANVAHEILSDPQKTDWRYVDRIAQLALYRNYVLRPVNSTLPPRSARDATAQFQSARRPFEHVVFINDVFVCPKDVLELVYQRTSQHAHAACAMDWRKTNPWFGKLFGSRARIKFYDNWVSRTLAGNLFRARVDIFGESRDGIAELIDGGGPDELTHQRFTHGLPMPVYSCWNGVIALPAQPFQAKAPDSDQPELASRDSVVSSRQATALEAAVHFRSTLNTAEICPGASECKILARDFWSRGLNRWLVIPTVSVTYERETYDHPALAAIKARGRESIKSPVKGLDQTIDWTTLRPPESVACYPWFRGTKIELNEVRAPPF